MLRLTTVKVERFKAAFKPRQVRLEPFALVLGRNGSGKSTVLEALQWIDATLRRDAREATEPFRSMYDLVNLRSETPYFAMSLEWRRVDAPGSLVYKVRVDATPDGGPAIRSESLVWLKRGTKGFSHPMIETTDGERYLTQGKVAIREPERLALNYLGATLGAADEGEVAVLGRQLREWWANAVFLRLSPSSLTRPSPAHRRSFEPLLDESGQSLPTLLMELDVGQREELVSDLRVVLDGIRGVEVTTRGSERDQLANYSLLEQMPYRGRNGQNQFPIPSWMLSEGTRRITAIFALLMHDPPPSFLCIEEVENGLDPWTVRTVLSRLLETSRYRTQVVVTSHSPWLIEAVPLSSVLLVRREKGDTQYNVFAKLDEVRAFDPSLPPGTRYVNLKL